MSKKRLLAAIMFTDIEGYTALMSQDEENAIYIRERHRNTFTNTTEAYNGEVVQYFGDGTLSVFTSAVEAVQCAIELQNAFLKDPKIPVRIGIHMGDILYSKDDIIGDAVNIASRIESCSVPGSVLISDKVHDQIRNHQDIKVQFVDAYELKNVEHAMPLFAISNEGLIVPKKEDIKGKLKVHSLEKSDSKSKRKLIYVLSLLVVLIASFFIVRHFNSEHSISDDLSIAVLPFENLSSEDGAEIFRDGVTEDILTQLSKLKELHVISRTSVMQYKDTKKTIPEIAKELGVSYVLEGSIRKYGDAIRITAQLIDANTDEHIWAENYDKTLTDIFNLQTEVSKEIVEALEINLSFEEQQRLAVIPTKSIEAYKLFLEGRNEADKRNSESIARSLNLYREAIAIDPNYAEAYAEIANSFYLETYYSGRNPEEASKLSNEYLKKAEDLNDKVSRIYSVRGFIYNIEGKRELADKAFKRAIELSPNDVTAHHQYATFFYYGRQYKDQLVHAKIAYVLDPLSFATANGYATALAFNHRYDESEQLMKRVEELGTENNAFVINRSYFRLYLDQRKYKEAIKPLKEIVKTEPVFNRFLGFCYARIGDSINANKTIDEIRKYNKKSEVSHQLAVVYAGLKNRDSVLFYLDTIRNKQTPTVKREVSEFFNFLKDDDAFKSVLKSHGIE